MSGQILTDAGSLPGHFLTDEDLCPGHFITDQDFWMSLPETVRKCPDFYKYKGFKAWWTLPRNLVPLFHICPGLCARLDSLRVTYEEDTEKKEHNAKVSGHYVC